MNTKWNALGFHPGLVGGHCIGVDPYYFIYQAEMLGYHSQIIAAGRKVNDGMAAFVTDNIIKKMIQANKNLSKSNIYIMGITFKENCPDMRNSKSVDVYKQLAAYGLKVKIVDPVVDKREFKKELNLDLVDIQDVHNADCLVFLVAHQQFKDLQLVDLEKLLKPQKSQTKQVIIDIKYWSL